jgi:superfamily II DNA or RNA helicase
MRQTLRLRPWQRRALTAFQSTIGSDFMAVATPGAGKTTFALTAARLTIPRIQGRLVIVAPTRHLKYQWSNAAEQFGLHLDPDWKPSVGLPNDVHGIVTTYQQAAVAHSELASICHDGFAILDEIHHAGDDRAWGAGVVRSFHSARHRLALSGTPFRSDEAMIPFLNYRNGQVVADVEYGYGDALGDGRVVRPVYFPRFGGQMEWTAPDGSQLAASFDDPLPRTHANQRLRTALSVEGEWLPTVVREANSQLAKIRDHSPEAAGLVIAIDQEHAARIAHLFRERFGIRATVVLSDDSDASNKIERFATGTDPWVIAVRMISEGVDIPRLRVGVYATTTTTELFFRQAVGRIVRFTGGRGRAFMYVPDDPRLRHYASSIKELRRHRLDLFKEQREQAERAERTDGEEQMSLFAVHSATITDATHEDEVEAALRRELEEDHLPGDHLDDHDRIQVEESPELLLDLDTLPPVDPNARVRPVVPGGRKERERLRSINAVWVRDLVQVTALSHAQVNAELNRLSGVKRVASATAAELQTRADAAKAWHSRQLKVS